MTEPEFDHIDPAIAPRMNEVFAEFRRRGPIVHSSRHGGFWAVLSYAAVREVYGDARTYTTANGISVPVVIPPRIRQYPHMVDPPAHAGYRRILQKHLTRSAVTGYEDTIRELTTTRLGAVVEAGQGDLVEAIAVYLPLAVITLLLGIPIEDGGKVMSWTGQLVRAAIGGDQDGQDRMIECFGDYITAKIAEQRAAGADTMITTIADSLVDGRPLTLDEQVGTVMQLLLAGHETTVNSISTMLYRMAAEPGLKDRLLADPGLVPAMIDECLRIDPPVIALARTVVEDTELAGERIAAGEWVTMVMSTANRDPEVFEAPDEFRCPREANQHVSFGHGVHRCVGEHLGLLEMRVVAEEVLRLMPHYRIAEGYRPAWLAGRMTRGLTTLPVVL